MQCLQLYDNYLTVILVNVILQSCFKFVILCVVQVFNLAFKSISFRIDTLVSRYFLNKRMLWGKEVHLFLPLCSLSYFCSLNLGIFMPWWLVFILKYFSCYSYIHYIFLPKDHTLLGQTYIFFLFINKRNMGWDLNPWEGKQIAWAPDYQQGKGLYTKRSKRQTSFKSFLCLQWLFWVIGFVRLWFVKVSTSIDDEFHNLEYAVNIVNTFIFLDK